MIPLVECHSYEASPSVFQSVALIPLRDCGSGNGLHAGLALEARVEEPKGGDIFDSGGKLGQAVDGDEDTCYGVLRGGYGRGRGGKRCGNRIGGRHCKLH